ncbi:MAG: hypothetical protein M1833_000984 [Piccolia ochrophora]|nr:MAG: hypothetical protein M1833_000984 [Piccolia ochrophora]
MQEHIRRAHPEFYISKLPATEESFALMINTPPSERPRESTGQGITTTTPNRDRTSFQDERSPSVTPRTSDEYTASSLLPAASAAAALAQLHNHRLDSDWDSETDAMSENEAQRRNIANSIELPSIAQVKQEGAITLPPYDPTRQRQLLPSILSRSPPGRSSTLPPIQRRDKPNRPRKSSITQNARKPQHERRKSRGEHSRKISHDGRKAFSAEPPPSATYVMGKRWEDLIDAATTATEADDDDRTPVPHSPPAPHRASLPPFPTAHFHNPQSYQASPLQHALTPPSYPPEPEPFPSVESGENFHLEPRGLDDSSPSSTSQNVQIYCAACQASTLLRTAYACTECICGICRECVDVLVAELGARRRCPRCGTVGGRFRPFQLDLR